MAYAYGSDELASGGGPFEQEPSHAVESRSQGLPLGKRYQLILPRPPSMATSNSTIPKPTSADPPGKIKRRGKCGQCPACQIKKDCGECRYCINKRVLRQSCSKRKCRFLTRKPESQQRGIPEGHRVGTAAATVDCQAAIMQVTHMVDRSMQTVFGLRANPFSWFRSPAPDSSGAEEAAEDQKNTALAAINMPITESHQERGPKHLDCAFTVDSDTGHRVSCRQRTASSSLEVSVAQENHTKDLLELVVSLGTVMCLKVVQLENGNYAESYDF